ncbi:MAG: valine--tRNA ligase [Pseudomonadota bacterium]
MLEKTFQPSEIESRLYDQWEESGLFAADPKSDKKPFAVMMPPPNVTGSLHMGHALNCTLHDILVRWNRMRGKDALWQPGLDHAGIATQMVVERELEKEQIIRSRDLNREQFVEKVWEWKEKSGGTIVGQQKRLGCTPDWERERFTMDEGLSKAVIKTFTKLYDDGLIYRDKRLVNWDPKFQTAISDLEVEHKEIKGKLWHVRYPLEEGGGFIMIATTRPETILADGAIAVHPDDEKYKDLVGKNAIVPVCNRIIPIIADEYVESEFGSGAVKITAAHDYNDFEVARRHQDKNIQLINLMNPDGTMNENCPEDYIGLDRFKAREKIIADLDELDYLDKVEDHKHQVPYGDRSGVVIEPYLTDQWYVDTPTLTKEASKAVRDGRTEFVPKQYENMYFSWSDNQQPWCISRQLWWGHQIPAWYDEDSNIFVAENEEEAQKKAGEGVALTRDTDVLDTWFSSALWPFSTQGWPDKTPELDKYFPGDVLITGFDIITFWVHRMMMMSLYLMGDVPFKQVYIHALVRDKNGQKMSKSKGNVIDPLDLIDQFGADALRFTLCAMAAKGRDVRLSEDRVAGYRNFGTKLWNATRFCEMNDCLPKPGFDPKSVQANQNKWILHSLADCQQHIDDALEQYRFNDAANAIYQFVWGTFCDWYLEFTKPILAGDDQALIDEVKGTTGWVLDQILLLLNPFMPFITEELYAAIGKREGGAMLLGADWPNYQELRNDDAASEILWVQSLISEIRSIRADMNVPAKAEIDLVVQDANDATKANLDKYAAEIKQMARLSNIDVDGSAPDGSIKTVLREATYILPIADLIDLDKERARLNKEITKLDDNIKKMMQQLDNKNFVANAPAEVIAEKKGIIEQDTEKKEKLSKALEQLKAA